MLCGLNMWWIYLIIRRLYRFVIYVWGVFLVCNRYKWNIIGE